MIKLSLSYCDEERELVEKLLTAAKSIFKYVRIRPPKLGADGKYHVRMNTFR